MTNYRRKRTPVKDNTKKFRVNNQITAAEIRVIDEEGGMVGLFPIQEALKMAEEKEMDLIEINPKANPPVTKLMEFTKFKYQQDKAEKAKPKVSTDIKTLRVSVRISIHDLKVQARKADEFLEKGIKVKLQVQMQRREKQHPEVAVETMQTFLEVITQPYTYETEPKLVGDSSYCTIKPKK
ncbi:MAG: translation initiation factor IF-3 [Patescibacteria group bacterium]